MTSRSGITGKTRVVGVWGHPVGHSRSPAMHNAVLTALGLDWVYVPFDVSPDRLEAAVAGVRALDLVGVNVTVPLKELVLPFLDDVSDEARRIGAVNTIQNCDGRLYGDSTDGRGFVQALADLGQPLTGRRTLLLGAGGSARAVAFAIAGQGGTITIINRTRARAEDLAERVNAVYPGRAGIADGAGPRDDFDLLVNTTSLGMHPQEETMPLLPPGALREGRFVYDLIYAPPETRLLREARLAGCGTANGLGMLVWQGALSLALWTGLSLDRIPTDLMADAIHASLGLPPAA